MKRLAIALLALSLSACSMPETKIYGLRPTAPNPTPPASPFAPESRIAVVVDSPKHLSQPYIAYRTSPYELGISRYAKWEAPPEDLVASAIKESLSAGFGEATVSRSSAPKGFYLLRVTLMEFERAEEGAAVTAVLSLGAELFSPDGGPLMKEKFSERVPMPDRSYLALAKAMSGAVSAAADAVRASAAKAIKK